MCDCLSQSEWLMNKNEIIEIDIGEDVESIGAHCFFNFINLSFSVLLILTRVVLVSYRNRLNSNRFWLSPFGFFSFMWSFNICFQLWIDWNWIYLKCDWNWMWDWNDLNVKEEETCKNHKSQIEESKWWVENNTRVEWLSFCYL